MRRLRLPILLLSPIASQADIVVDQFGYRTDAAKVAMARNPKVGYDSLLTYTPGAHWSLVDSASRDTVLTGTFLPWNSGAVDAASGDQVWSMDFSACTRNGTYTLVDPYAKVISPRFRIEADPYKNVLRQALRTFYYQRAGQERLASHAGSAWADAADHLGAGQDGEARRYLDKNNASLQRDLRGGWFQDGTNFKYTSVACFSVIHLLKAYEENPSIWGDDQGLPESGNGIPDIVDEALWEIRWLERMQNSDGSCLSISTSDWAWGTPPSAATGGSYYGDPSASSTLHCAAAFAVASSVLARSFPRFSTLSDSLRKQATSAWGWARSHSDSTFHTQYTQNGTLYLGWYDQEDYGLHSSAPLFNAAVRLFHLTGDSIYRNTADSCLSNRIVGNWPEYVGTGDMWQDGLAEYASDPNLLPATRSSLRGTLSSLYRNGPEYLQATRAKSDPYRSNLRNYGMESNHYKVQIALDFWTMGFRALPGLDSTEVSQASEEYLHDIHGRNPLATAFLTSMSSNGATRSVTNFYHIWFADGTDWDQNGVSQYGPPPGYLSGGPNPNYALDRCCPGSCGTEENNMRCALKPAPPLNQPPRKSWKDFNNDWPLNSWSVNDNSTLAQAFYVRLLSKFVGIPSTHTTVGLGTPLSPALDFKMRRLPEGLFLPLEDRTEAHAELFDLQGRLLVRAVSTPKGLLLKLPPNSKEMGILRLKQGMKESKRIVNLAL